MSAARKKSRVPASVAARRPVLSKRTLKHLTIVTAAGILVRVIYNLALTDSIFFDVYLTDSLVLHTWATDILAGRTADLAFFRAPLYPYLLSVLYQLFGVSPWPVIVFQNLLGLMTAVTCYFLARRLFSERVAFWSALLVVLYPTLFFFEGETMITTLAVFLYTLCAYLMVVAARKPAPKNIIAVGLVFGLAAITRPSILPLFVILPLVLLVRQGRSGIRKMLLQTVTFAVAVLIPIVPVTMSNLVKGGELVLISTQGGANFYIGNNRKADGITVIAPGPQLRIGPYKDNIWTSSVDEAEYRTGRTLSQSEVSSFWYRETFKQMLENPGRAVTLMLRKIYLFWHGQEIFNNKPVYYAGEYSWLLAVMIWKQVLNFPSGLLFPLMFVGMGLACINRRDVTVVVSFTLLFSLVVSAFFVCARFRQPIVPLAIVLATYAVFALVQAARSHRRRFLIALAATVLLLFGLNWGGDVESDENHSQFSASVGSAYLNNQDYEQAIPHLEHAIEIVPSNLGVYDMLGQAYMAVGRVTDAERIYAKGVEQFPTYPIFNFNLGRISQRRGDLESAREFYRVVAEYAPDFPPAFDRLGYIFDQQGQIDSALYYYRRLAELKPNDMRLQAKIRSLQQALEPGD